MKNKSLISATTLCLTVIFSAITYAPMTAAQTPMSLGLGVKLLGATWTGENDNQNTADTDFESTDGGQLGFNLVFQRGKFYTGVNLQSGDYKFEDDAPNKVKKTDQGFEPTQSSQDETIKRGEADILVGYYFWPRVSMFLDLKVINNQWQEEDVDNKDKYGVHFVGLGGGVSTFIPIGQQWVLFGSVGVVPKGTLTQMNGDKEELGDGSASALELGAIFNFDRRNRLNFGVKLQAQNYEFDNGEEQEHRLAGAFIGYNHLFLFHSN